MSVDRHVHVGVSEAGAPVRVFNDRSDALDAIDDAGLRNEDVVDVFPDVPLVEVADAE
ncbi:hypothetical protein GWK26_08750 [haloarchaeon 3A1-DGR]|nr:hypothetical protein GWK26_08750 [haloarchaeon 3A1-DGR]